MYSAEGVVGFAVICAHFHKCEAGPAGSHEVVEGQGEDGKRLEALEGRLSNLIAAFSYSRLQGGAKGHSDNLLNFFGICKRQIPSPDFEDYFPSD